MIELSESEARRLNQQAAAKKLATNKEILKTIVTDNFEKELLTKDQLDAVLYFIRN